MEIAAKRVDIIPRVTGQQNSPHTHKNPGYNTDRRTGKWKIIIRGPDNNYHPETIFNKSCHMTLTF